MQRIVCSVLKKRVF